MRRKRAKISLSDEQRLMLKAINRKSLSAQSLVLRSEIILLAEELQDNKAVAIKLNVSAQIVGKWCHRWNDLISKHSIEYSLGDAKRSGTPSRIGAESLCQLVALACDSPEKYNRPITHWTQQELQDESIKQGIFKSISPRHIGRLLEKLELRPHKNKYWLHKKADEFREQKIANICAIYKDAEALKKNRNNNG